MSEWKTIESAPRDGSHILAWNGEIALMRFISGDDYALWVYADTSLDEICPEPDQPSHWMPLPNPPQ